MNWLKKQKIGQQYLHRWHLVPENPFANVLLHHFIGPDKSDWLHDHPWPFMSILLKGRMCEEVYVCVGIKQLEQIKKFKPRFYGALHRHRIEMTPGDTAWTIVITGPTVRLWAFYDIFGWMKKLMDGGDVVFDFETENVSNAKIEENIKLLIENARREK